MPPAGQTRAPLGLPRGSVRSLMSLGVVLAAGAIAGFLLAGDSSADLTKMGVGGWIAALGNGVGFYFGARAGGGGRGFSLSFGGKCPLIADSVSPKTVTRG